MKSYYNIIKIAPNPIAGDTITIGLLVFSNGIYKLQFSKNKINITKRLIDSSSELVDYIVKQINNKIDDLNKQINDDKNKLFSFPLFLDANYFDYLNRYCNNNLQFSKPFEIEDSIDDGKFKKLFSIFVSDDYESKRNLVESSNDEFYQRINNRLISRVKEKVHTNINLTEKVLPSLYFQFELDCIGKNGVITSAKSIDFSRNEQTIDKQISRYFQVSSLLAKYYQENRVESNLYIIGDEPNIINSKEHKIWEQIEKQKLIKIIHSEQSDIVANKIEEINAHQFLDFDSISKPNQMVKQSENSKSKIP